MKLFVILSDNGSLRAGNTTRQSLDKLEANGFTPVSYSEDFLNAMSNEENAFFLPQGEQDIEVLRSQVMAKIATEKLATCEYAEVYHYPTLQGMNQIKEKALLALAVRIGNTRLIDNTILEVK